MWELASKERSLYNILWCVFFLVLMIFLCSVPVFYIIVSHDLKYAIKAFSYPYAITQLLRFIAVVIIACIIRTKYRSIFVQHDVQRKGFMNVIIFCICISILLHIGDITPHLYGVISAMLRIFEPETTPLFLTILWEQLFSGELYWSILLATTIVFFRQSPKKDKFSDVMETGNL